MTVKLKKDQRTLVVKTVRVEGEAVAQKLDLLLDEDGSFTFVGQAQPGTLTSAAKWRIFRMDESGAGAEELILRFANGTNTFDKKWDDRKILSY